MDETAYPIDLSKSSLKHTSSVSHSAANTVAEASDQPTDLSLKSSRNDHAENEAVAKATNSQASSRLEGVIMNDVIALTVQQLSQAVATSVLHTAAVDFSAKAQLLDENAMDAGASATVVDKSITHAESATDIVSMTGEESNMSTASREEESTDRPDTPKSSGNVLKCLSKF